MDNQRHKPFQINTWITAIKRLSIFFLINTPEFLFHLIACRGLILIEIATVKHNIRHIFLRVLKVTGIAIIALLALLFILPFLFPDTVSRKIKTLANRSITGKLDFSKARLSFFHHFPSLTLTLYDVALTGSAPYQQDTLLGAKKLGFGINLQKLVFGGSVNINKFYLEEALVNVEVNENGEANYNIYKSSPKKDSMVADTSSASLKIEKILITDTRILYNDHSIPMHIDAEHFNYEGTGDLSKSIFDLTSHIRADSLSFVLSGEPYVTRKAIDADLVTQVNTNKLALIFQKNDLSINKLALQFSGRMDFRKNGYDINFDLRSRDADLYQLITAFPPDYIQWLQKTTVKGRIDLHTALKGAYTASTGEKPDFKLDFAIRDGFIAYQDAKIPLTGLQTKMEIAMPQLNAEKLTVNIDSLSFGVDNGFFRMKGKTKGVSEPEMDLNASARLNLASLKNALGFGSVDVKGNLDFDATARGKFARKVVADGLRKVDTVISSVPVVHARLALRDGLLHYLKVPEPITGISLAAKVESPDADYHHAFFTIDSLRALAGKNHLKGHARVNAAEDFPLEGELDAFIDLGEIRRFYPLDSVELRGKLVAKVVTSGKYSKSKHLFPKTQGQFDLDNGYVQTKYYPHPVDQINIRALATDEKGTLSDLTVKLDPASLRFEGKPFTIKAGFSHFDDLNYNLSVVGDLDLGRIYKVFAVSGTGLTGLVHADASFKGKQSDALSKHYERLDNKGVLNVSQLRVTNDNFPHPFLISRGDFRFDRDKMWFEKFLATYQHSDVRVDGYLQNAINYVLGGLDTLHGNFNVRSKWVNVNEFTAFSTPAKENAAATKKIAADTPASAKTVPTGVVIVPKNIDFTLKAQVDSITYSGIRLDTFSGGVNISHGIISLLQTRFGLIGAQVGMSGKYASVSPKEAVFEYHLNAADFDVKRAYNEITLFHDLVSSAANAQGIISLDYGLSGRLNDSMRPVKSTLAGGGTLTVKKVQFKGWKLFNTAASRSNKADLADPDLSKIDLKSSINKNLISIPRVKFKTGVFRIRLEGQTTFDDRIRFKMRIGLPPLGIIGIPLHVSGTSDHPKIGLGRQDKDQLEELQTDSLQKGELTVPSK